MTAYPPDDFDLPPLNTPPWDEPPPQVGDTLSESPLPVRPRLFNRRGLWLELVETLFLIVVIYTLVNLATSRYQVEGQSMLPNFLGGEYLIVNRFEYMYNDIQRGDIVIFHYPRNPEEDYIKRVIGLPGDHILLQDGQVFVNGQALDEPYVNALCSSANCRYKEWTLGPDEFFVLGDNRNSSQDSTSFGPVPRELIVGRAWVKYWPPSEWEIISHHRYGPPLDLTPAPPPTPTPTRIPPTPLNPADSSTG